MSDRFLCIHGHFYQPPRENPWMEEIEPQDSARPFHDWNEKIHYESYLPNTKARVLDEKGRIVDIVNNFNTINFNFGPTLMAWLEAKHPGTYEDILAADRASVEAHHGHGNAMAQVYNHMILPLASRRDKVTQVKWGVQEFRHRFGREPEAIWLAETACDEETLEVLVEEGMKYVILAPHQAEEQIDPRKPYRYFLKKYPEKHIDVFFYDGLLSKSVGFEDLLFDAKRFMHRIREAEQNEPASHLISVATDGETFGHHKPFGDRVLAYLLNVEAPKNDFQVVNFGEYLEQHPPQEKVRLKYGEDNEGTSWSCEHGVKRWKEHCGCRGGGPAEWNQHWRKPLREALDWLRDEAAKIFESEGRRYFSDPWKAREDYIRVILGRSEKNLADFFSRHTARPLEKAERVVCLKLLEMQRHVMLMYTSCGWFFTELSGIETVQIIQYAARALQLAREVSGVSLEEEFLSRLSLAKSNLPEFKDGRVIYEKMVLPRMISLRHVASFYGIHSLMDETLDHGDYFGLYCFKIRVLHQRKESFGDLVMHFGRVHVASRITGEEEDLVFVAVHTGLYDFRCSVKPFRDETELEELEKDFFEEIHAQHLVELMRKMDRVFGTDYYSLKDLPLRERLKIISVLTHEMIEKISEVHERLYDENRRMSEIYRSIHLPIPEQIRYAAEYTLKRRLDAAVKGLAEHGFNPKKAATLQRVLDHAQSFEVQLKTEEAAQFLNEELARRTESLLEYLRPEVVAECVNIQKIAKKIKVELQRGRPQEHLFNLMKRWQTDPSTMPAQVHEAAANLLQLLIELQIHPEIFKKILQPSAKV